MPEVPSVPRTAQLTERVAEIFAEDGTLAQTLPAFESRPAQREMATAVATTFQNGGVLLVEAGTGTGKTLAYLVPAILSGERVLISTGTKNLQEQIYFKDLSILREALGLPVKATYMKGRGNFLCLHRFDAFRDQTREEAGLFGESAAQVFLPIIEDWAAKTEIGDRAEIAELPEDVPFWNQISAISDHCLGTDCPRYDDCFITKMRRRAEESQLVVVNHHLLCADAAVRKSAYGEVIPECRYAVIDEAHQIEDVATQYFGVAVSNYRIEDLVRDAEQIIAAGVAGDKGTELGTLLERLRERGRHFFDALSSNIPFRGRPSDYRLRLTSTALEPFFEEAGHLITALDLVESTAALIKTPPPDPDQKARPAIKQDLASVARRAGEIREDIRFVLKANDPEYVYFLETRGRGLFLRAAPINVSAIVQDVLFEKMRSTVLTSATLTVDGSFDYIRSRLGLHKSGAAKCLKLPSEFDYARQAILYLPKRMPDPRSADFTAAAGRTIISILEHSRGRAFVLFTSYAAMRAVQTIAEAELDYPILVQGTAPRSVLLQQFRTTPHAVLLATSSFWQGVDVMGDALSCVIIDKLPFASPADPITAARIELIAERGGQPFGDYQVPLAILTLLQGLGRLIRHRDDRGVLAVLDPRLQTMAYGRRFLASMPPAAVTRELDDIRRFFAGDRGG